jgi:uncharacterized membrane-anchored protein YhcB (DUF1043 family)
VFTIIVTIIVGFIAKNILNMKLKEREQLINQNDKLFNNGDEYFNQEN